MFEKTHAVIPCIDLFPCYFRCKANRPLCQCRQALTPAILQTRVKLSPVHPAHQLTRTRVRPCIASEDSLRNWFVVKPGMEASALATACLECCIFGFDHFFQTAQLLLIQLEELMFRTITLWDFAVRPSKRARRAGTGSGQFSFCKR